MEIRPDAFCESLTKYVRFRTREVMVGSLGIGGNNPIRIQSMTTTDTMDTRATVDQSLRMIEAGSELVRITAPSKREAENLRTIKEEIRNCGYKTPIVADIHFTPNAALIAATIVEKVRINPGNYADRKKFDFIVSNPPYYHDGVSKSKNDSLSISRYNTHLPLTSFIKKSNQIIAPKGDLIFCYDAKQLQMILSVLSEFKFIVTDIRTLHGTAKKPSSLVMIHAKKSSKSLTKIHPPLIHFKDDIMSKECEDIYQKTRTYSIKCKIM
jgi:hypothetical protein